jgi:hypothetical protein
LRYLHIALVQTRTVQGRRSKSFLLCSTYFLSNDILKCLKDRLLKINDILLIRIKLHTCPDPSTINARSWLRNLGMVCPRLRTRCLYTLKQASPLPLSLHSQHTSANAHSHSHHSNNSIPCKKLSCTPIALSYYTAQIPPVSAEDDRRDRIGGIGSAPQCNSRADHAAGHEN